MAHVRAEGSVIHGYPHLAVIRRSITGMYRSLSSGVVSSFGASLTPESIVLPGDSDLIIGVQYLARAIVRHLKLPEARMIVTFRNMNDAGHVELARGPEYFIELHTRYQRDRRDIAAVLAHEVMHAFLHRARCRLPDTHDNEILTDTAATYLGIGWPILNAYRHIKSRYAGQVMTSVEKVGYLTPEEFGYVLGKRALAFGENVERLIRGYAARRALWEGTQQARRDYRRAPLRKSGWANRVRYAWRRRRARSGPTGASQAYGDYEFRSAGEPRVVFECPVCHQRIRLPLKGRVVASCPLCKSSLSCVT